MSQSSSSKKSVRILPESLINKIAAGEVVERPASVVKELLENAIDAGATDIQVTVKNGGKDLISILDNGCGMNEADAQLAVERHATSKIIDEDDLFRIQTLGFRGEALAAIASVSHFELLTCDDESQGATRIFIKGGYLEQVGKIGFPQGTRITVERLFYNTPARLKFLKTTATELQHIQQHLVQKSLAHPHIHFRLTHNRQLLLNLSGGQELNTRIRQLFGEEFRDILMTVQHKETYLRYSGFISFPSKPRTSRRWQYIFVNERNVKSPSINHGIYDGYGTFLGKGQHPVFFLNLVIDPTEIDVNVHPAKTEIRFRNSQLVHTILTDQISSALKDGASRRFFGREHAHSNMSRSELSGQIELPMNDPLPLESQFSGMTFPARKKRRTEARDLPPRASLRAEKLAKKSVFSSEIRIEETRNKSAKVQDSASTIKQANQDSVSGNLPVNEIRNLRLLLPLPTVPKKIRVLGQFRRTYIIAENDAGLVMIEQRALHERLLYEIYAEALQIKDVPVQTFQASLLIELSPQESVLLEQSLEPLAVSGFAVSPFGGSTFAVNTIPEILSADQVEKVIREILDHLALFGKRGHGEEILQDICQVVVAHGSMPAEQELALSEMECLLAQWEELGSPLTSLQDVPVLVEFSVQELERRLKR
ncbi:MAG TPA: DNA mismatch repair endonuclease MutL [Candidatus Lambdaproteobacteria bacterium]|nr:DNA mismatch repair endonuclease MutL [Deltaproteobacteria bacterium]HIB93011.1 DNA mismatch repair endonuclease MutL [Candidatus Lambdaproteobacteria bacterium]HIO84241.1 DNA mismatch repair endonuclease MutL [Deltaproteobacteria bacterium]